SISIVSHPLVPSRISASPATIIETPPALTSWVLPTYSVPGASTRRAASWRGARGAVRRHFSRHVPSGATTSSGGRVQTHPRMQAPLSRQATGDRSEVRGEGSGVRNGKGGLVFDFAGPAS